LHVSPTGRDSSSCSIAAPCRSLGRAYRLARPGETILVAAGTYPAQTIDARPRQGLPVVIRPASRHVPRFGKLTIHGSSIEIRDIAMTEWITQEPARDVTFRDTTTGRFTIAGAAGVSVIGGSAGPSRDASNDIAPSDLKTTRSPTRILIDGVHFHGYTKASPGAHVDCVHSWGVDGLVIRNSRFENCEHFDILLAGGAAAGLPRNVTIENNFFDCCRSGFFSVYLGVPGRGQSWSDILVRNNSANKDMGIDPAARTAGNVRFYSNVAPKFQGCGRPGVTSDYNVWSEGRPCGSHDVVAPAGYADPSAHDFHLSAGAAAVDHGNPAGYPANDIDGQSRPRGRGPDAGADERG
jgi:hypothetical protein